MGGRERCNRPDTRGDLGCVMTEFTPDVPLVFYDNDYHESTSSSAITVVNPATEEPEGVLAACDPAEVERVVGHAAAARPAWAGLSASERARHLHAIADSIETRLFEDTATLLTSEHGKPYPEATGELANTTGVFRYYAELARHDAGVLPAPTHAGSHQFARYFPYGVSAHITPSNFPLLILSWTLAASLAAGNTAVVKPSEAASLSTLRFMAHFRDLPTGVVSCVTGRGETGRALVESPGTDVVAFTGTREAARDVAAACARRMKPCVIEAGGNDPMVVTATAPLEVAIPGAVTAAFHLSGQVCTGTERFYVHEAVHDEFVAGLVEGARALRVGNGLESSEIGPLVSEAARDRVAGLVEAAVADGASVACGGRVPPDRERGWFYEPTVLTGVTHEMSVVAEEVFGPVAPVCEVASMREAIRLANDSSYGLGASVFTTSFEEAFRAYDRLEAGLVWVNNPLIDNDALPFGGWKQSGVGRELGRAGLDAFRQAKAGVIDWDPGVQDWWYPYPDGWFYGTPGQRF